MRTIIRRAKSCFSVAAIVLLSGGCAQGPAGPGSGSGWIKSNKDIETVPGQRYPDEVLRIVAPAARTLEASLMVVGALSGAFWLPTSKSDYRGTKVDTVIHPAMALQMHRRVAEELQKWRDERGVQEGPDGFPLRVRRDTFALVFRDYFEKEPVYELKIETTVSRRPTSEIWIVAPASVTCKDVPGAQAMKLADWAADDYAKVKELGQAHIRECVDLVGKSLDTLMK